MLEETGSEVDGDEKGVKGDREAFVTMEEEAVRERRRERGRSFG
jgi:hypothetical protein